MNNNTVGPELYILLAEQRSGTHFLRSMLNNVPGVVMPSEICNPDAASRKSPTSFLRYRASVSMADGKFFYPTTEVQTELLDNYFAFVRTSIADARHIVLDVKYSHVYNFHPCWWSVVGRPFLLDYAIDRGIRFIHLIREQPYRTVISNMYAQEAKIWHVRNTDPTPSKTITVDRAQLQIRAFRLAKTIGLFSQWLNGAQHLAVSYEKLANETKTFLAVVRDFLGLKADIPAKSEFVKSTPRYEQVIENFSEIADLIDMDMHTIIASHGSVDKPKRFERFNSKDDDGLGC